MKAIIVGSGIGGLTVANALYRAGHEVRLFERAPELTEVGAGISLWANALYALDALGIGQSIHAACQPLTKSEMRVERGHRIAGAFSALDFERAVDFKPIVGMIHRAELVGLLASHLPSDILRYGAECVDIAQSEDRVSIRLADGSSDSGDVLIGADGIRSIVRSKLLGEQPVRYSGYTCYRGVCPRPTSIPAGYMGEWWGRGQRVGITTLKGDRIYWWATNNSPANVRHDNIAATVRVLYRDWADPVPELLASTPEHAFLHNDIVDRPPNPRWSKGRVVLIGDAAHPTTPNLGQGGCMAIEDGVELVVKLDNSNSIERAFEEFAKSRYPRTTAITRQSKKLGSLGQWHSKVACWLRDRAAALAMPTMGAAELAKFARHRVPTPTAATGWGVAIDEPASKQNMQ
jgi:2-polyprenyl-6-methoxyphenol hydroxylase-like FAD-dependent oxidoreductase